MDDQELGEKLSTVTTLGKQVEKNHINWEFKTMNLEDDYSALSQYEWLNRKLIFHLIIGIILKISIDNLFFEMDIESFVYWNNPLFA